MRILVADDKPGMREGCREALVGQGYEVDVAADGLEAWEMTQRRAYDLLVVDVKMPKLDGLELLGRARGLDPDVVCVVITGYATLELAVQATKLGAYDFLAKPFTPRELLASTGKALEVRRLALETRRLREERDRSLLAIATEKSRLRTTINCIGDGVLVINREGQIALVNPAAQRLLAPDGRPLLGRAYTEAIEVEGLREIIAQALVASGTASISYARELRLSEGGETTVAANAAPIVDDGLGSSGETLGCVAALYDITRVKELEKVREQFVRLVAHELRAPLAAISQSLDAVLIGAVAADPERQTQMLRRCQVRATELLDLIEDLLRVSAIEAGRVARKVEPVDLGATAAEVIELLSAQASGRGVEVRSRIPADLPLISADRADLVLVLTNLVGNAVKYNRDGGWIEVSAQASADGVSIEVADGGYGIPEAQQAGLFKEFYRVRTRETARVTGTGLGLSIVKRLVEAHRGRVWVRSKHGEGSTFGFWLPRTTAG